MEVDLGTLATVGGGGGGAAIFGWQLWRMWKDDSQTRHQHTQANHFANTLLKESESLKKENKELREETAKSAMALAKATADITILKSQMVTVLAKFEEIKKENDCLCQENKELKAKSKPVGKAGEGYQHGF